MKLLIHLNKINIKPPGLQYDLSVVLNGCKQQTPAWQKVLYEHYYGFAISICMRYAPTGEDAIEIMNDGFVKIFKGIISFREPDDDQVLEKVLMAWIKRIMINTGINFSKSVAGYIFWTSREATMLSHVAAGNSSSDGNLRYEDLLKFIQRLSPAYRNTFCLYAIDGYTHEEIANLLGTSVGTSKSNLMKARRNLKKMLEKVDVARV